MAVVYSTTLKSNRMQLVNDLVSGKAQVASSGTASAGKLVIGDSTLSGATGVLATIALPTTPFSIDTSTPPLVKLLLITGGGLTVTASASGTAAKAEFRTNADVVVVSGLTVGTSSADIILGSTAVVSGNSVTITAGTITHG